MKEGGWALVILGLLLVAAGMIIDVSVNLGYVPGDSYLPGMPREVANLHKMHIQALVIQGGLAAFLGGMVAIGSGAIVDALRESRPVGDATREIFARPGGTRILAVRPTRSGGVR